MPFIKKKLRKPLLEYKKAPEKPGEYCFLDYVPLMEAWKKEKRWTTIHNECKRMLGLSDVQASKFLAFMVFFNLHAMPYEKKMSKLNGGIK